MNNSFEIRLVRDSDYAGMLAVYAPSVINTSITFDYEVPSLQEFTERINKISTHYPCLVCETGGVVVGYAYGSMHRFKTAYQWSTESTIYVDEKFHGLGVARVLYDALLSVLELQGFINVYAGVTLPNPKSEKFHLAMGFAEIAVFDKIGYDQKVTCKTHGADGEQFKIYPFLVFKGNIAIAFFSACIG